MAASGKRQGGTRELARSGWLTREKRAFDDGYRQLRSNLFATVLSVSVMALAIGAPVTLGALLNGQARLFAEWGSLPTLSVFLHKHVGEKQAQAFADRLREDARYAAIEFISSAAAFAEFSAAVGLLGADANDDNPLPNVLIVTPTDATWAAGGDALARELKSHKEVDAVLLDQAWVERLRAAGDLIRRGLWVLGGLLLVASILVVANATRALIQDQVTEIRVQSLVGATDSYVRRPFLYAGIVHGGAAGVLAVILVEFVFFALAGPVERLAGAYLGDFTLRTPGVGFALAVVLGGVLVGWLGGWIGCSRTLRRMRPGEAV